MTAYRRYGIYVVPGGALGRAGAAWLGWDIAAGATVPHPEVAGLARPLAELTRTPRRYGLHATIKPPFRLAPGTDAAMLADTLADHARTRDALTVPRLALRRLGRFLALVPAAPSPALDALAASTVRALDGFRAAPTDNELARRRAKGLTPRQEEMLHAWGYPYVMAEFRFHITLTGPLGPDDADAAEAAAARHFAPVLKDALDVTDLALVGEDADGRFHLVTRAALHRG